MLNKKKIGLGMLVAGGLISIAGLVIMKSDNKKTNDELVEMDESEFICPEKIEPKTEEIAIDGSEDWVPRETIIAQPCESISTYNPTIEPVSMSQEDIESMGNTF